MVEPSGHCPYLGLKQNRAIRFASPTPEHRCYVAGDPQEIPVDQASFCLSSGHVQCPLYTGLGFGTTSGTSAVATLPPPVLPRSGLGGWFGGLSLRDRLVYALLIGLLTVIVAIYAVAGLQLFGASGLVEQTPPPLAATATASSTPSPAATPSATPAPPTASATPAPPTATDLPTSTPSATITPPPPTPQVIFVPVPVTTTPNEVPPPTEAPPPPTEAPPPPTEAPPPPTEAPPPPTDTPPSAETPVATLDPTTPVSTTPAFTLSPAPEPTSDLLTPTIELPSPEPPPPTIEPPSPEPPTPSLEF